MIRYDSDVLVIGAGLAGLVAAVGAADRGLSVTLLDQESERSLGGQAFWSFGGLFLVDTPEQRRLKVSDSRELAVHDWVESAGFDDSGDEWGRRWAEAYVDFATDDLRPWLRAKRVSFFPVVGWAERRSETGSGNSVPRFHITWGTGPGLVQPFARELSAHVEAGRIRFAPRHRVTGLDVSDGRVVGAHGDVLRDDGAARGHRSGREAVDEFEARAGDTVLASGGIGGDLGLVRAAWPAELGAPPPDPLVGVPAHVDGSGLLAAEAAGAAIAHRGRMWHYTEGITNWDPIWPGHGIRILPGPSSLWLDSRGERLPAPCYPGFDTLATLRHLRLGGHDHSWFVLTQKIIEKEFTLSGSEQNPDLTGRSVRKVLSRVLPGPTPPVQAFIDHGIDFHSAPTLDALIDAMREQSPLVDGDAVRSAVAERDAHILDPDGPDQQAREIHRARAYLGDRLVRTAAPHRLTDPKAGPLYAVRLHTLTRKTLGGVLTDLDSRALGADGAPVPGLFAVGEAAGFGGGGVHGRRALEGTFLGGCLFTGRAAGRAVG